MTEVDLVVRILANIKELKEPKKMADEEVSAGEVLVFGDDASPPATAEPPPVGESGNVHPVESQPVEEPSVVASPEFGIEPKLETSAEGVPSSGSSTPEVVEVAHPVIPFQFDPNGALKKAVLSSGVATDGTHRSRAINLRWVLRDIRAKRTTWWPVGDRDLRVLIEMGLVEMREDVPVLTTLGLDAIA